MHFVFQIATGGNCRRVAGLLTAAALLAGCALLDARGTRRSGSIRGRVLYLSSELNATRGGPLVVLATPVKAPRPKAPPPSEYRFTGCFPPLLVVPAGGTVRVVNDHGLCHAFFSSSRPNLFETGPLHPGQAADVALAHGGVVHVYCSLHPGRQGTILVTATPYRAMVGPDGGFAFDDLPPGRYLLETWSETLPTQRADVFVGDGDVRVVDIPLDDFSIRDRT